MKSVLVQEEVSISLPMCESSRGLVINPVQYASHVVFNVGALKLIDRAP